MHTKYARLVPGQRITVRVSPTHPVRVARFERYGDHGDDILVRFEGENALTETSESRIVMRVV